MEINVCKGKYRASHRRGNLLKKVVKSTNLYFYMSRNHGFVTNSNHKRKVREYIPNKKQIKMKPKDDSSQK
jgi:uncharacterized protein (UPF0276 family)